MTPITFPEANASFKAPADLAESQVATIMAYCGPIPSGSMDGEKMIVVAWKPDADELAALNAGQPVFLTTLGGLPPHFLTTDFANATNPA
jgi:hypothetical protein